jgi:hypothetical protein
VAPADAPLFAELKQIFPVLRGWVPLLSPWPDTEVAGLEWRPIHRTEDARYELSQTVLLLNVSGGIPDAMLSDAALFGVLCIGTGDAPPQTMVWPGLAAEDPPRALELARALLTDPALAARIAKAARLAGQGAFRWSEEQAIASLRRLHSEHWSGVAATGR